MIINGSAFSGDNCGNFRTLGFEITSRTSSFCTVHKQVIFFVLFFHQCESNLFSLVPSYLISSSSKNYHREMISYIIMHKTKQQRVITSSGAKPYRLLKKKLVSFVDLFWLSNKLHVHTYNQ